MHLHPTHVYTITRYCYCIIEMQIKKKLLTCTTLISLLSLDLQDCRSTYTVRSDKHKRLQCTDFIQCIHVYIMVNVNTADRTGNIVKRNRFWRGRVVLCVTRCTRAGTPVVGCPQHRQSIILCVFD